MKPLIHYLPLFLFPVVSQAGDIYCEARLNDHLAIGIRMDDRFSVDPEMAHYGPLQYTVYWDDFNRCELDEKGEGYCTQTGVVGEIVEFRAAEKKNGIALIPLRTIAYEGMEEVPPPAGIANRLSWKLSRRVRFLMTETGMKLIRGSKSVDMQCSPL